MADLLIRFKNAARGTLDDRVDVVVRDASTNTLLASERDIDGRQPLLVQAVPGRSYTVTVKPRRHRPGGQQVLMPMSGPGVADLHFPLHPKFSTPTFPPYAALPGELTGVLERSRVAGMPRGGRDLYEALSEVQRAGLLNLFCKMQAFAFDDTRTVWSFIDGIYDVAPDRIFADVDAGLPGRVRAAVEPDRFREVNGALHKPPRQFRGDGSFKTGERYGNLQLSFFASTATPTTHKVDADIDDAAGLVRHTFQVLRNRFRNRTTHPYDIHQVLVFRQQVQPPYGLA